MRTNWMKRAGAGRDNQGRSLADTHLIGCYRRSLAGKTPEGQRDGKGT